LSSDEQAALDQAEQEGKQRAKEEDPQLVRNYTKPD
jgi:hypothetical protein